MTGLVRATFKKTVSDNHFGGEMAEVTLEQTVEDNEDDEALAEALLAEARRLAHAELARSPSAQIRHGVALSPALERRLAATTGNDQTVDWLPAEERA